MKDYIRAIINLELVPKLFVMMESDTDVVMVSATTINDNSDFMRRTKILDREFILSETELLNQIQELKKLYTVDIEFFESEYKYQPYKNKVYVIYKQ